MRQKKIFFPIASPRFFSFYRLFLFKSFLVLSPAFLFAKPSDVCIQKVKNFEQESLSSRSKNCQIAQKVLGWLKLRQGKTQEGFGVSTSILRGNAWPQPEKLYKNLENTLSEETPDAFVLSWFQKSPPHTGAGALYFLKALKRKGDKNIEQKARQFWESLPFNASDETLYLKEFGVFLKEKHHFARCAHLLWEGKSKDAERLLRFLSQEQKNLIQARLMLMRNQSGVEKIISRLSPKLLQDEGLLYSRTHWRRQRKMSNAAEVLLGATPLTHHEHWGKERAKLVRQKLHENQFKVAYQIAHKHHLSHGATFAELEWLSGWIALRYLNQPQTAQKHFLHLFKNVSTPMSLSRAAYWAARSYEVQKDQKNSKIWHQKAASYPAYFYGQLSLSALKQKIDPLFTYKTSPPEVAQFLKTEEGEMLSLLAAAQLEAPLKEMIEHLADRKGTERYRHILIDAVKQLAPRLVVFTAKRVGRHQNVTNQEAYPLSSTLQKNPSDVDPALLLGIMRQESGFDQSVESPAGAVGLMQLMKNTAKEVAIKMGIGFSPQKLKRDGSYNIRLGAAYVKQLLKVYNDNPYLTLAAYNGGLGNVRIWMKQWGDPRSSLINTIDWIESIGFAETRHYVQRVTENMFVYQQILKTPSPKTPRK